VRRRIGNPSPQTLPGAGQVTSIDNSFDPSTGTVLSLAEIYGVMLRRYKLVALVGIFVLLASYGIVRLIPPLYKSTVEILVVDPKQHENGVDGRHLSALDVDAAAMDSEIAILSSKAIALRVVKQLGLAQDPEFQHYGTLSGILEGIGLPTDWLDGARRDVGGDVANLAADRAAEILRRNYLSVDRVQYSYVLAVSVQSHDPKMAQRLSTAVAQAYLDDQVEARHKAQKRATNWLTGRLDDLRQRVLATESNIEQLKAGNGLADTGAGGTVAQQQTADLDAQLVLARADLAEKRARYEQAQHVIASNGNLQTIPEVIASPVIGQLRAQRAEISRREADLTTRFGQSYPAVIQIRSQLSDLDRTIAAEVGRILDNLKNAYEVAQQREQSLEGSLEHLTDQRGSSRAVVRLRELEREDDVDRKLYESFLSLFNEMEQRSTLNDSGARVITPATLPSEPSYPRKALILCFAAALGGCLGIALAFAVEYLDAGFKTRAQVEQTLGCPVLGMIPLMRGFSLRPRTARDMLGRMIAAPLSALGEAVRAAQVGLVLSNVENRPKAILVTSAVPGEGKSTVAALIATSSGKSGQRSLLIDGDLRRKSTSRAFGPGDRPGLTEIFAGTAALADVVHHDDSTGIDVISAGPGSGVSGYQINTERMQELLDQLRGRYDFIVIDSSPLLPVIDAAILATMVDRTVLVVEWSQTPRTSAVEALQRLTPEAQRTVGVLINKVDHRRLRTYGYGYGYGYNYGRYYGSFRKYYQRS
jgi:polysaccharide biosynthesis transport protein